MSPQDSHIEVLGSSPSLYFKIGSLQSYSEVIRVGSDAV